ncbi:MAG: response regulator [Mycobacteriaceae bacterium]
MTRVAGATGVLVVDDEPLIADAHAAYVRRCPGFTVLGRAHTGAGALQAVRDLEPALMLLDLGLPDRSGIDVCRALHALPGAPDVIAITAARDLDVVRDAVASGVLLYLLKPFTFAAFRDKLQRYADYRAALPAGEVALSQRDVDRAMTRLRSTDERATTPKGVDLGTLEHVGAALRAATAGCSAAEAAAAVGVSRVTAWRYLERLAADGLCERGTEHGRAGRPVVRYTWRS